MKAKISSWRPTSSFLRDKIESADSQLLILNHQNQQHSHIFGGIIETSTTHAQFSCMLAYLSKVTTLSSRM